MKNKKLHHGLAVCFFAIAIVFGGLMTGCETMPADSKETASDAKVGELRVGDTVQVDFSRIGDREIPRHEEQIKDDGTISLYLIGSVKAAGKTTGQLQNEIQTAYNKYYVSMTVTVRAPDRFFSVGGQVKLPNRFVYVGGTTVIKAIQAAGDFTDYAKKTKVQLTRTNGKRYVINYEKALRNPSLDLPVYPGDYIYVPQRRF
ncbi:MAG: polysaccharide biosynthesis/export family protein [Verrucomicrobiota bacterium]